MYLDRMYHYNVPKFEEYSHILIFFTDSKRLRRSYVKDMHCYVVE